jgi:hypothetical protein
MPDHAQLEEALTHQLHACTDGLSPRNDLAERAITRHHRARRRTQLAGATAVVAAVAAGVVATGAVGGSQATSIPGSGGPTVPRTAIAPMTHTLDTAYIVSRVRAHLAHLAIAGKGQILEKTSTIGNGTADSPVVHNTDRAYIDPRSGVAYQRSVDSSANGTTLSINELVTTPDNGVLHTRITFLDPLQHTYFTPRNISAPPGGSVASATSSTQLGIKSTARQIDQALSSNTVKQTGTATIDGQSTIKLSVAPAPQLVKAGLPRQTTITLYVNAQTYQPIKEVEVVPDVHDPSAGRNTSTSTWLPTTAATIALTKLQIPVGYKQVSGPLSGYWTNKKPLFFIGY